MSVARLSLPSVVSAERLPTSCPVQDDSRVPIWSACSNAMRRFGEQGLTRASSGTASRRGDTGGSPPSGAALVSVLERDETVRRTRRLMLTRASSGTASLPTFQDAKSGDTGCDRHEEGHRGRRRGSFLLSLLIAGGMQPRLCRLERHRLLARKAELGAVPPHPVKYHADAPGQGNGRTLLATELRQT